MNETLPIKPTKRTSHCWFCHEQIVHMEALGKRLRQRARELGLSDAEVARRADLSERRYANYVADKREPDFATFLKICSVLNTTPNDVLGVKGKSGTHNKPTKRSKAVDRLVATANAMSDEEIALTSKLADAVVQTKR